MSAFALVRSVPCRGADASHDDGRLLEFSMWITRLALRPYTFIVMALLIAILGVLTILTTPADVFPYPHSHGRRHLVVLRHEPG